MYTIPHARPDLHLDLRTGEARVPTVLAEDTRSAQERNRAHALLAEAAAAPDPGPDAPAVVRAEHAAATRPRSLARLENGTPVSGDLIAILRASGGNLVIARTVSQIADDLRDSVPELIREGTVDVETLVMIVAAWLTGGRAPARYAIRARSILSRHVFQTREEAVLILEDGRETDWKAPGA